MDATELQVDSRGVARQKGHMDIVYLSFTSLSCAHEGTLLINMSAANLNVHLINGVLQLMKIV